MAQSSEKAIGGWGGTRGGRRLRGEAGGGAPRLRGGFSLVVVVVGFVGGDVVDVVFVLLVPCVLFLLVMVMLFLLFLFLVFFLSCSWSCFSCQNEGSALPASYIYIYLET